MKISTLLTALAAFWCVAASLNALADPTTQSAVGPAHGQLLIPPPKGQPSHLAALPAGVRAVVEGFQADQERFMKQYRQEVARLASASADARSAIREELRRLRQTWLAEQQQFRQELRDRLQEVKTELKDARAAQLRDVVAGRDHHHQKR